MADEVGEAVGEAADAAVAVAGEVEGEGEEGVVAAAGGGSWEVGLHRPWPGLPPDAAGGIVQCSAGVAWGRPGVGYN